jgi:3-hydroxybutyryl-CoA dehydrogenase
MKICVIGAGTMGAGIAQTFASAGYEVLLCDVSEALAEKGRSGIEQGLLKLVSKGKLTQEACGKTLAAISVGRVEAAAGCGLVLEAVKEDEGVKRALFAELEKLCGADTIFATNTSSLSITALSAAAGRPVVGMHFFNPAPVMSLVEVVEGLTTPPELVKTICALARQLGKTPVVVKEAPGFVVNRLLIPMINEAVFLLAEGVASAEDIDAAMRLGANHPIGPLALADLIGNDVVLAIMEALQKETGEDKYRPCPLLRRMVRGGMLGRKAGSGFFQYAK